MKEILTQLFGDAVTEDALKQFNAELGKKFVSKADYNAKLEDIKTLKSDKSTLESEISKLTENASNGENIKAELNALKTQIAAEKAQAEAERIAKEKADGIANRFNAVVGDKEFSHDAIKSAYLAKFTDALANKENEGKSDAEIFHALTKDDAAAFKGVTPVRLAGGTNKGITTAKKYESKADIMKIKDTMERQAAIKANPELFINQ